MKIERRDFLKVMGIAGCAAILAGCGASSTSTAASSAAASTGSSAAASSVAAGGVTGKVSTGGSTSMEKVMSALMEGFAEINPDVDVTYDPTGSSAGITGATDGTLDIGLSSRKLKEEETGVTGTTVALDGIAVIVSKDSAVEDLSLDQIASIFTGEITNWKDLGGADAEIVVIGREAGSGTRDGFEEIVGVADSCVYKQELTATGAVISAVASDPNGAAIGYASLSALDDSIKAVTVAGVACTEETVKDGSYLIQRPFLFVTNDSAEPTEAVSAFMDYATSADAADLIRAAGAVPMV